MLAELTSVLAKVHGNDLGVDEFMLVRKPPEPVDDRAVRAQNIVQMFAKASKANDPEKKRRLPKGRATGI